jgi:DnaJ-class molecular chaperone
MPLVRKTAEEFKADIDADIAEIDGQSKPKTKQGDPTMVCDCTGGPNKEGKQGTGLLDYDTLCPKCNGNGWVPAAQG